MLKSTLYASSKPKTRDLFKVQRKQDKSMWGPKQRLVGWSYSVVDGKTNKVISRTKAKGSSDKAKSQKVEQIKPKRSLNTIRSEPEIVPAVIRNHYTERIGEIDQAVNQIRPQTAKIDNFPSAKVVLRTLFDQIVLKEALASSGLPHEDCVNESLLFLEKDREESRASPSTLE